MMDAPKKTIGAAAEQRAQEFLRKQGLKFIMRNYRCKLGEIDLIMQDAEELVFVEVRTRTHIHYGDALESVSQSKQQKIMRTSLHFLQQRNWLDKINWRFDVIGISENQLEWIKNAFTEDK